MTDKHLANAILVELLHQGKATKKTLYKKFWTMYKDTKEVDAVLLRFLAADLLHVGITENEITYMLTAEMESDLKRMFQK